nr:hypothetical protein [Tanacetum cinerariifolium]
MPRFTSIDMVHNHYLEEAKKKIQERSRNSKPSLMPSARSKNTANGSKPMPRRNTQTSRNWPASENSFVTTKTVPIAEHPRNSRNYSFGLRWVPTGKIFASSTTKVDSEPLNDLNADITNQYECEQTLDVCACTLNLSACTSFNPKEEGLRVCSELGFHDHNNEQSSSKLVPKVVPPADKTSTSRLELEFLFHHHITMLRSTFLRYDGDECDKGRMPTKIELTLKQSQQSVSNDVLVSIEGVEELKRNVWIKGENKAALPTLKAETRSIHMLSVFIMLNSDELLPSSIESDDRDSEWEIHVLEELLVDDTISHLENELFYFDHQDDPSFPGPPPEPPDVEFNLGEEISAVMNNIDEFNKDECFDLGGEINVFTNLEDGDYFPFMFVIQIFLPYLIYPEVSPLLLSTGSKDTIFDPGISI